MVTAAHMIPPQHVMPARVHPSSCAGTRFSSRHENSFRCHVNAVWLFVSWSFIFIEVSSIFRHYKTRTPINAALCKLSFISPRNDSRAGGRRYHVNTPFHNIGTYLISRYFFLITHDPPLVKNISRIVHVVNFRSWKPPVRAWSITRSIFAFVFCGIFGMGINNSFPSAGFTKRVVVNSLQLIWILFAANRGGAIDLLKEELKMKNGLYTRQFLRAFKQFAFRVLVICRIFRLPFSARVRVEQLLPVSAVDTAKLQVSACYVVYES